MSSASGGCACPRCQFWPGDHRLWPGIRRLHLLGKRLERTAPNQRGGLTDRHLGHHCRGGEFRVVAARRVTVSQWMHCPFSGFGASIASARPLRRWAVVIFVDNDNKSS